MIDRQLGSFDLNCWLQGLALIECIGDLAPNGLVDELSFRLPIIISGTQILV